MIAKPAADPLRMTEELAAPVLLVGAARDEAALAAAPAALLTELVGAAATVGRDSVEEAAEVGAASADPRAE